MKKTLVRMMLGIILLGVFQINAYAGAFTAFGPKTFIRGSGKPITETATFSIKNPNTIYTLKVYNGGNNSEYSKVSSAIVRLNGSTIFDTNNFNQQVPVLQKEVRLSKSNQLQVELRSATGSGLTINIEGEDDTPPAISVTSPLNGSYTNNPTITVSGTASDSISWINKVTVDGTTAEVIGGNYTSNIQLTEGQNLVTAVATDAAGNTGNASLSVILDTISPKITLDPIPSLTNKLQLTVTGKVEDASPITALTINGIPATLSNNTFAATINLTEGNNTIHITAADKAGNNGSASTGVILDTIPPTLTISGPAANATLNTPSITITGYASDEQSGIATVAVNGINAAVNGGVYTASNVQLAEGPNTITVTATDNAGNISSSSVTVTLDTTAPVISMTSPINGSNVNIGTVTVTGTVDDNAAYVAVNGIAATVSNGTFTAMNISLTEGVNTITVTAKDVAGNSSTVSATVTCQLFGPESITIDIPQDGTTVNMHYVRISGTINNPAVSQITINGNNAWMSGTWFGGEACLAEGTNTLTIMATNSAGQSITRSLTVYAHDTQPPYIYISSPSAYSTVTSDTITVSADIYEFGNIAPIVTVNGVTADVVASVNRGRACNVAYTATVPGIKLAAGQNIITVTATDAVGNTSTATVDVTYTIPDTTPPAISITSPINLSTVNTNAITVTGTIDGDTATVTVNGVSAVISNNVYTASNVTLYNEGANTVTVTATDPAGNTSTTTITVYKDTTAPVVAITSPLNGSKVTTKTITVTGTIDDNTATVTVNGISATVSNITFMASGIQLTPGGNNIVVTATDIAGNTSSQRISVYLTPPITLNVTSPINGGYLFPFLLCQLSGTVSGENMIPGYNFIPYVYISVNGASIGNFPLSQSSPNTWIFNQTVHIPYLKLGSNTITFIVKDGTGGPAATSNVTVYVDLKVAPLAMTISSPHDGEIITTDTIDVTGAISDNTATVKVNEQSAIIINNAFTVTGIKLTEGSNTITVTATDRYGNVITRSVFVMYVRDITPPVVSMTSPVNGATVTTSTISVAGSIDDNTAIVTVNGITATVAGNTFTASGITLADGQNTISVTATDSAGNTSTVSIAVTYARDTVAPVISITSPANGSTVQTGTISVAGAIDDNLATVTVNGTSASVSGNTFTATNVSLSEGENNINVIATDPAGNIATAFITVTYVKDTIAPVISITSPTANSTVKTSTITVTGTIDDTSATVTVNGTKATVSGNTFTASGVQLANEGANTIIASATDGVGNTSTASITAYRDTIAPVIFITSPTNGGIVEQNTVTVSGTIDDSYATVKVNGINATVSGNTFTAGGITLILGNNTITATAVDTAGNTSVSIITVTYYIPDTTPPVVTITYPSNNSTVYISKINVTGTIDENTATVKVNGINATVSNNTFMASGITLAIGSNTITVNATDAAGNSTTYAVAITYATTGNPPDPATIAPSIDNTVASTLSSAIQFLYTGDNPIQYGVFPETIEAKRAAVIRGKVSGNDGTPLSGVKITILNHPEYGNTQTREDGIFDMVVNGGGWITVNYEKNGYLPVQRKVDAPWQDYAWVDDVVMIPYDSKVTAIDLNSNQAIQVAESSTVTDKDGTRKATLLFPQGTYATMQLSDGTWMPLNNINVRATEYTVGENGPKAMPGPLPPSSGYTYAVELSLDEAVTMGAKYVSFSKPVINYVENFLNFPVGGIVPVGWYDREKGVWVPSDNGKIVKILYISGGMAVLDVEGYGSAASSTALVALGITDAERQSLATLYQPGQSLWRVPITHFTPWDHNWPYGPPEGATGPEQPQPEIFTPDADSCTLPGSIIECQNQTLGESIDITGTPFSLNYRSDRVTGRKASYKIKIPLSGGSIPPSLKRIDLEIEVAGRKFSESFGASPNQSYIFTWDGKDAYGRTLQGVQPITTRTGYVYQAVYQEPANFMQSFGAVSGSPITGNIVRMEITIWQESTVNIGGIGNLDARGQGMGAWTLSTQHSYDISGRMLYLGNGERSSAGYINGIISTVAGNGSDGHSGDGGVATSASLSNPYGVAIDSKGNLFVADYLNHRIRRVGPDGIITTVAGNGTSGYSGDGGPATSAQLYYPWGIAVDSQDNLYIADYLNHRIRKVNQDGIITTVAGNGTSGYSGDGGPATDAQLKYPQEVAVDNQGNLFISDTSNYRIRKVGTDGIITTVAGNGTSDYSGDGGPATSAQLKYPQGVAVDSQGNLFIADWASKRIRKVGSDGIITTVAGNGICVTWPYVSCYSGDGGPATNAQLFNPGGIAIDRQGNLFIADVNNHRIRSVSPDGKIITVAGNWESDDIGDGGPAVSAQLNCPSGVAVDSQGNIFISDTCNNRIRKVGPLLPGFSGKDFVISSQDGKELYSFDASGKHLMTLDTKTGMTLYTFGYGSTGYLTTITDKDGNVTMIERDTVGNPTAIIVSGGQRTVLTLDSKGYLASVTNPNGEAHQMTYTSDGLLLSFTKPNGATSGMTYDELGRLIKDEDPAGGFKALSRTEGKNVYTVTVATAENRKNTYRVEDLLTGDTKRTNTDPVGLTSVTNIATNGTTTTTSPDGTVTTTTQGPDPRFGMQAPVTTSMTIKTPSGLTYTYGENRTISLSDSSNPLSIVTKTDTTTINGKTFTSVYDATTNKITATTPVGRQRFTLLDDKGRIAQERTNGLEAVGYAYDEKGRLVTITEGSRVYTISYDSLNQISSITDAANRTVNFAYDLAGRVTQQTLPDGRVIAYSYDANGNITSITPPGRPAHTFTYDSRDLETYYNPPDIGLPVDTTQYTYNLDKQLILITRPDGQTVSLGYDSGGRLSTITIPTGQISYTYNLVSGNLESIVFPGQTITYTYDGSLLTGVSWSGTVSGSVSFTYNNDFRVASESVNNNSVTYQYDSDGLITGIGSMTITRDAQNGFITGSTLGSTTTSQSYNSFGELSRLTANQSGSPIFDTQYTRDSLGRITAQSETISGHTNTYTYTYDTAGRLTDVSKNGVNISHYEYDQNGNRVSYTNFNGSVAGVYDEQDRLISYDGTTYSYTANGELQGKISNGQATSYHYDVLGNLVSITLPDGTAIEYVIDGQNRRIGKKVNGVLVQGFLYQDQLRPIAELDGTGAIVSRFVYGTKVNVPAYMVKGGITYRILTDHLGSPRLVVNASTGAIVQQLDYDAYGSVTNDTNLGFQPFGFAGGLYDRDTRLVRFGARDYDAETGKWTAKDDIRFEGGDTNLYGYLFSEPINRVDQTGNGIFSVGACAAASIYDVISTSMALRKLADEIKKINEQISKLRGNCPTSYDQEIKITELVRELELQALEKTKQVTSELGKGAAYGLLIGVFCAVAPALPF